MSLVKQSRTATIPLQHERMAKYELQIYQVRSTMICFVNKLFIFIPDNLKKKNIRWHFCKAILKEPAAFFCHLNKIPIFQPRNVLLDFQDGAFSAIIFY